MNDAKKGGNAGSFERDMCSSSAISLFIANYPL
jgi:hypothetical protein